MGKKLRKKLSIICLCEIFYTYYTLQVNSSERLDVMLIKFLIQFVIKSHRQLILPNTGLATFYVTAFLNDSFMGYLLDFFRSVCLA